jgi:hypothetical protein
VSGEEERNFSNFMVVPSSDDEKECYEAFYNSTSNEALSFETCPICGRRRLTREGEKTLILSDSTVAEILTSGRTNDVGSCHDNKVIMRELLDIEGGEVCCWMCLDCLRALERGVLPKLALANNLWMGDVPSELVGLTIPEQLLIARHYPRCYIFKLFPRDVGVHFPLDQLYSGMAGNASLFELNTQEVIEMLKGQRMPSPVRTLASVIAITFVSSKTLPMDWLKKTFRVRRDVVLRALLWLQRHNPIYADICVDRSRLEELPEDDIPPELLSIIRQEEDDDVAEHERESYVLGDELAENDEDGRNMVEGENDGEN